MTRERLEPNSGGRRGFVVPLVVMGILAVSLFVAFVHSMGSGYSNQVAHVDEYTRCRIIGESAFSRVLGMIRNKPYRERFFAKAPYRELGVSLFRGKYNLYVVDAPGHRWEADIYVEACFQRCQRLFFWRVKFENSVLDAVGRVYPILFASRDPGEFPAAVGGSPLAPAVDDLISIRHANQGLAGSKASLIRPLADTKDMIKVLDGPSGIEVADDLAHGPSPLPAVLPPLTAPPTASPTVLLKETFDDIPGEYNNLAIPGFTFARRGDYVVGPHIEHSPPTSPKCYMLGCDLPGEPTVMVMPLTLGSRLIIEFDYMIEVNPTEVPTSPEGAVGFCDASGNFTDGKNSVIFRADGKVQFGSIPPREIGTWEDEKWVRIKTDLDLDGKVGDVYVNGSLILQGVPIYSRAELAGMTHFGVRSAAHPTEKVYSNLDTLLLSE